LRADAAIWLFDGGRDLSEAAVADEDGVQEHGAFRFVAPLQERSDIVREDERLPALQPVIQETEESEFERIVRYDISFVKQGRRAGRGVKGDTPRPLVP